jgi:hypothetical protein
MTDPFDPNANCLSLVWSLRGTRFKGVAARGSSITDEMPGHSPHLERTHLNATTETKDFLSAIDASQRLGKLDSEVGKQI